jgi:hypothetical protein
LRALRNIAYSPVVMSTLQACMFLASASILLAGLLLRVRAR